MKRKNAISKFFSEVGLLIATVIMMIPVYYFVISSFKSRKDVIKAPLLLNKEMLTLENFP